MTFSQAPLPGSLCLGEIVLRALPLWPSGPSYASSHPQDPGGPGVGFWGLEIDFPGVPTTRGGSSAQWASARPGAPPGPAPASPPAHSPGSTNKGPVYLGQQDTPTGNPLGNRVDFLKGGGGPPRGGLLTQGHTTLANSPQLRAGPWGGCEPGRGFLPHRGRSGLTLPGLRMSHSGCPLAQPGLESQSPSPALLSPPFHPRMLFQQNCISGDS